MTQANKVLRFFSEILIGDTIAGIKVVGSLKERRRHRNNYCLESP